MGPGVLSLVLAAAVAPGAPGVSGTWTTGAKQGIGTATTAESKAWYTLANGELTEVYYPRLDVPQTRDLQLLVGDGASIQPETTATSHRVELVDPQALVYRQVNTRAGRYRIAKTYVTDPTRSTLLVQVRLDSLDGGSYKLYVRYDPSLAGSAMGDSGQTSGDAALASEGTYATALAAAPGFVRVSTGYAGRSDDPLSTYDSSPGGNVVQIGEAGGTAFTLALAFGASTGDALANARASLAAGFDPVLAQYEAGWHSYLATLTPARVPSDLQTQYDVALMTLRAGEDKTFVGANVASPTIPWGDAADADAGGGGGYHLVWARDLYQVATAQLAAGDRAAAGRALDYLLRYQQRPDGTFPQNSTLNGTAVFSSLQLDEVAFPLVLAWQLGRTERATWLKLKRSADVLARRGPFTPQERWEEAAGYSPSTIAAEIAGLVCAADLARRNGDLGSADVYLGFADLWQRSVERWTVTTTGPLGPRYYERIDQSGNPNDNVGLAIANGGGSWPERTIVDAGFLELVRLGVKRPNDPTIAASVGIVDRTIGSETPNGPAFRRYNHDGYGETAAGDPYTGEGIGRLWPLLTGERGEYELANGRDALPFLRAMANFANEGHLIPEQVWDRPEPTSRGFVFGEGTGSATPLGWAMAQFVRLAHGIDAGRPVERPALVASRYAAGRPPAGPRLAVTRPRATRAARLVVKGTTTGLRVTVTTRLGRTTVRARGGRFAASVRLDEGPNVVTVVAAGRNGGTTLRQVSVARPT